MLRAPSVQKLLGRMSWARNYRNMRFWQQQRLQWRHLSRDAFPCGKLFMFVACCMQDSILTETITSSKKKKFQDLRLSVASPTWSLQKQMRKKVWRNFFCLSIMKAKAPPRPKPNRSSFVIMSVRMVALIGIVIKPRGDTWHFV